MNEKYIQALIIGSLIGGAILLDDIITPKPTRGDHVMMFKADGKRMHEIHHPKVLEKRIWKNKEGAEIDLDDISSEKNVFMLKLDKDSDLEAALGEIELEGISSEIGKIEIEKIIKSVKDQVKDEDAEIKIEVRIEKDSES
jgi:hypothetical protein